MNKFIKVIISLLFVIGSIVILTQPVQAKNDEKTIVIGSTAFNQPEVLQDDAVKKLEEMGYKVESVIFENATLMNEATMEGSIDTSLHQHQAWMDNYNKELEKEMVMLKPYIHYNTYSIISDKIKSKDEIKDNSKVVIPNEASNQARAMILLQELGLIKLKEGVAQPSVMDIEENPHNFQFTLVHNHQVVATVPDVDFATVATYQVRTSDKMDYVIYTGEDYQNYGVGFVVNSKDKDSQWAKDLIKAYNTPETKIFVEEYFDGAVISGYDSSNKE